MSAAAVAHSSVALPALERLYEREGLPAFDLPVALSEAYGGPLGFAEPRLYANFVATLDGVVALPGQPHSNRIISDYSAADRFVMGLLRACADAVLVGADTMREAPGTVWTAEQAHPPAAELFDELRRTRERPPRPTVAVLSGHGTVDPRHPALEAGALVLTSEVGAARLRNKLPRGSTTVTIGPGPHLDPAAAVAALRSRGHRLILCEGGPTVFGALLGAGLVDELFLTTSPLLAGRSESESRRALVEGVELLPGTTASCDLLTLKHCGSQLFARYGCRVSSWSARRDRARSRSHLRRRRVGDDGKPS
jgi:riboflavin biosynthesis pyrimidine reductase